MKPEQPLADFDLAQVVSAYKSSWESGERPELEACLSDCPPSQKPSLFRELLAVELHELRKSGDEPDYQDYVDRFSSFADVVDEQFYAVDSFNVSMESTINRDAADSSQSPSSRLRQIKARYRYIELLGRGGFGEVWKAHDELLGRDVALKGPRRDRKFSQQALDAFIDEARRGSQLHQICSHVVNVIDIQDDCGVCFIVMELMQGGSLATRMAKERVPPEEAAELVAQIAEVLAELHRANYVHRDIKPANILFDEAGTPHLADLGLAMSEEERLDEPDAILGTLHYMPLEQATRRSNQVDGRADIYSLGVIFYQLLSGRLPYRARDRAEYVRLVDNPDGPKPPRQINQDIPVELERICLKCIQPYAKDRYQTAKDISRDIRRWQTSAAIGNRRIRHILTAGTACALLIGIGYLLPWLANVSPSYDANGSPAADVSQRDTTPVDRGADAAAAEVTPLVFPDDQESTWVLTDEGQTLHVSSTYLSLLGIGEIAPGANCQLSVDIHQLEWRGRVGLFWGYRVDADNQARLEILELGAEGGSLEWKRIVITYSLDNNNMARYGLSRMRWGESSSRRKTLVVNIRDGRVDSVTFDGDPLPDLTNIRREDDEYLDDCNGLFGVYNLRSAATFSNVTVNDKVLKLRKP